MDELPSDWSIGRKLVAVALFIVSVAATIWLTRKLVYEWLPEVAVGYIGVAIVCLSAGWLWGNRSAIKRIEAERRRDASGWH